MSRQNQYIECEKELDALLDKEAGLVSNLANTAALLHNSFNFFWTGFYLVNGMHLSLGPFQGPVACTRIQKGKGVCGSSWEKEESIVVPNVEEFPGHISCNAASKSEIVIPVFDKKENIIAILDIDSKSLNDFDELDKLHLEKLSAIITRHLEN